MILRNSLLLAIFSVFSVLLGILRDRLLAVYVGIGPMLDVYNASFRLPDLVYGMFLAFITAGTVVPFLTRENKEGRLIEAEKRFTSLLFFFSILIIMLMIVVVCTIQWYAHLIVPGFSGEQLQEFIFTTRLLMVQPLILGLSSLISCFAQYKNEFLYYAIAPLGYSLGIILGIIFLYQDFGVNGLIFGVILGSFMSLGIQSVSLKIHKFSIRGYNFSFAYIKELVYFAFPRTFTNVVSQLRVVFFTAFATTLGPGALSSFLFAQRITDALAQIVSQSVTAASIPTLSREHEEGKIAEHERTVYKYTSMLFIIALCISGIVFLVRYPLIEILYSTNTANALIATFLVGFLITLPFTMASSYLVAGFYSMKNTSKVFFGNTISSIISVAVIFYCKDLGVVSLIYGVITHQVIAFVIFFGLYRRSHFLANAV